MKAITFLIAFSAFLVMGCKKESVNNMYPEEEIIIEDTLSTDIEIAPDTLNMIEPVDTATMRMDTLNTTMP